MSTEEEAKHEALKKEQEEKKQVVIDAIKSKCTKDSPFEDLRTIGKALEGGDEIVLHTVSGGETNFSYKVSLKSEPQKGILFAKISFNYARWNPDRSSEYDVQRAVNEFDIMNSFADMMGGHGKAPVAKPYYCLDVDDGAKLLVAEWSVTDEQFANQFVDGKVDMRVIDGLAKALATLNLTEVEPEWNEECRACMLSIHPLFKQIYGQFVGLPDDQADACVLHCKKLGLEKLEEIVDNLEKEYVETRQVLCHNDTKQFNILVEKKPDPDSFGETGSFVLCDWEMTIKGRSGKDIGICLAWPIACCLVHAVRGHKDEAYHILATVTSLWDGYEEILRTQGNKDDEFLVDTFRGCLGGTYLYLHVAYYMLGLHVDSLPLEDVSEENAKKCKGALGFVGLRLGELHYLNKVDGMSLKELKDLMRDTITTEIEELLKLSVGHEAPRRISNINRKAMHRPSDAAMMADAARRISQASTGGKRASIYDMTHAADVFLALDSDEEDE